MGMAGFLMGSESMCGWPGETWIASRCTGYPAFATCGAIADGPECPTKRLDCEKRRFAEKNMGNKNMKTQTSQQGPRAFFLIFCMT